MGKIGFRKVCSRAFRETHQKRSNTVITSGVGAVGGFLATYLNTGIGTYSVFGAFVGIVVLFIATFLWKVLSVPYAIANEAIADRDRLKAILLEPHEADDQRGLLNAIMFWNTGDWLRSLSSLTPDDVLWVIDNTCSQFEQMALDNRLIVRGKRSPNGAAVAIKIPHVDWEDQQIDRLSIMRNEPQTEHRADGSKTLPLYYDLTVSEAAIRKLANTRDARMSATA